MKSYDSLIIGFGKAGKTLAAYLAQKGERVALAERSNQMYGGTCINVGCIPSKSLVTAAARAARMKDADFEAKAQYYAEAIAEKRRVTALLREKNYAKLSSLPQVDLYDGLARFVGDKTVELVPAPGAASPSSAPSASVDAAAQPIRLTAEKIFINTGSQPFFPPIPGLKDNPHVFGSETLMELDRLPRRLAVIGAGYIGMEFASMYANFGSEVTVFQDRGPFLPKEDRDVAEAVLDLLKEQGVHFELGAAVSQLEGDRVVFERANGEKAVLQADAVLVATGRRPAVSDLQLEQTAVRLTDRAAVEVNDRLETGVPGVWALGDVNGGPQFTFISLDDFRIVRSQLEGGSYDRSRRGAVVYSVFMDTPLGRVGLTEEEARAKGLPVRVKKLPTAAVPKAVVLGKTGGFLKAVLHAETGRILGAALLCPEAFELINLLKLAMDCDLTADRLRDAVYTHPTMTEAFNDLFS